jgi:hypothetical protein
MGDRGKPYSTSAMKKCAEKRETKGKEQQRKESER